MTEKTDDAPLAADEVQLISAERVIFFSDAVVGCSRRRRRDQ